VYFVLVSLAQKGGEVVHFSALPKNEPHSPLLCERNERKKPTKFWVMPTTQLLRHLSWSMCKRILDGRSRIKEAH
jgi:hypothetical protein